MFCLEKKSKKKKAVESLPKVEIIMSCLNRHVETPSFLLEDPKSFVG